MNDRPAPMKFDAREFAAHHRFGCAAAAIILILEIIVCNLPFWTTIASPQPITAPHMTLGSGLSLSGAGVLRVDDPTEAYIDVSGVDAPVRYVHYVSGYSTNQDAAFHDDRHPFDWTLHVRMDVLPSGSGTWRTGETDAFHRGVDASTYLRNRAADGDVDTVRIWIQETVGSQFAFNTLIVNAHPPFRISVARVAAMVAVALVIGLLRPRSRLYAIAVNTHSMRQRLAFAAIIVPFAVMFVFTLATASWSAPREFSHEPYSYTYDFNQYAQMADSLLHGRPWLDLPVPHQLAEAANPYDVATRDRLLGQGVGSIYWDHVFFEGHWYSYFGVVPSVVLFLPYQAITSLWTEGGLWLPTSVATSIFLFGFLVFSLLLVVRMIDRFFPKTSVGVAVLVLAAFMCGSNGWFLWLRPMFYELAPSAALMFTALGLWLWLSARRVPLDDGPHDGDGRRRWRTWTVDDVPLEARVSADLVRISLPRVAAGSLCIALTLGCRATFIFSALLFLPIFADEIRSGRMLRIVGILLPRRWRLGSWREGGAVWRSWRADLAALLPAFIVFALLMAYNFWRFGSWLDFGNNYQLTVTDLTRYREPLAVLPQILGYYLFEPPRFIATFPWIDVPYMPVHPWQYTERMICGFLWFAPVCLLAFALPRVRRRLGMHRLWGLVCTLLGLGVFELVFVSYKGGMDWRYVSDFGWLFALGSAMMIPAVFEWAGSHAFVFSTGRARLARLAVIVVVALVFATMVMTVAGTFVPSKIGPLMRTNPTAYYTVRSWFVW
ncbi:hypothetical protein KIH77_00260 [Bifidobacterium sp. 82T24]|uniref:hypothetical protein n=1 Tax=Bifidobacterium pluvialisilvae TaxID=2834436 RepID=UPI001C57923F|nr:hypothetical protein [Bifidobacterium pluvialisilvae]MBW3087177.1 hypothetical protein [Bifidobacterium pluvialisilvae]